MKGSNKLLVIILMLVVIPFVLLGVFSSEYYSVNSTVGWETLIGRSFALAGFALLCINLILSAKLKLVDRLFGGLDKILNVHASVGRLAYIFLLLHPAFLGLRYLQFSQEAFNDFFLSLTPTYMLYAKTALLLFTTIIGFTLFSSRKKIPYEILKTIHRFMGVVLVLGLLHALETGAEIYSVPALNIYYLVLAFTSIAVYVNRSLLGNALGKRYSYEVSDVNKLSDEITQITLCPVGEKLKHKGGQFQFISIRQAGFPREIHPFTISSGSDEDCIRLSIETYGDFTKSIPDLKVGSRAIIDGPYGGFTLDKAKRRRIVMLAGNIGITPLLSMIRSLSKYPKGYNIRIIHSISNEGFNVFNKELKEIDMKNKAFMYEVHDSSKDGHLDLEELRSRNIDWKNVSVFICGSAGFNKSMIQSCKELGADPDDIHYEEFKLL